MTTFPQIFAAWLAGAVLASFLVAACWFDVRSHRIPNALVACGMAAGLALNFFVTWGAGFFDTTSAGVVGPARAMLGALAGFGAFLPLYLIRGMGAGDVKLMAMVGSFIGPIAVLDAALMTLVVGGAVAMAVALYARTVGRAMSNVRMMVAGAVAGTLRGAGGMARPMNPAGKVPYAIAIAGGTLAHALLVYSGHAVLM